MDSSTSSAVSYASCSEAEKLRLGEEEILSNEAVSGLNLVSSDDFSVLNEEILDSSMVKDDAFMVSIFPGGNEAR